MKTIKYKKYEIIKVTDCFWCIKCKVKVGYYIGFTSYKECKQCVNGLLENMIEENDYALTTERELKALILGIGGNII